MNTKVDNPLNCKAYKIKFKYEYKIDNEIFFFRNTEYKELGRVTYRNYFLAPISMNEWLLKNKMMNS